MLTPFSHSFLRNLTAKLVWLHNVTCELKVQYKEPKENQESSFYFVKLDLSQTFLCALFVDAWPSRDMDGYLQHLLSAVVLWGGASSTRGSVWLSKKCSRQNTEIQLRNTGGQPSTRGRLWLSKKDHKAANFSTPDSAIICSDKNDGPRIFLQKS